MPMNDDERLEVPLLTDQLTRMRGMLYGYSDLFFRRIRDWAIVSIALLVIAWAGIAPAAAAIVAFLVPFAFLETGYLFFYTVFARRYAERLECRINRLTGTDALIAHRLEAAYFYPPDARKVAALSLGNPVGLMSVTTIGYSVGAALLWVAGFSGLLSVADGTRGLGVMLVPGALLWTAGIAGYLVWTFWTRHDEVRLLAELDRWEPAEA